VKGGRFWIAFVVALLVGNAVAMGVLLAEAGDPTPRVLPDYYRKAIAWDETVEARRASAQLGWRATVDVAARLIVVELVDRDGAALPGAAVEVAVRPRSRADRVATIALAESAPGRYVATWPRGAAGLHEVELIARRGDATFLFATTVDP
jgi:nitrogen fixation protein FixH